MSSIYEGILTPPATDFSAVRDGRRQAVRHFDVDLSVARSVAAGTALVVDIASELFLADVDPINQGDAIVHFQETQLDKVSAPIYVTRGFKAKTPFTRLLFENAAQAGKRCRFFYGIGLDLEPGGNNVTISGTVSVVDGGKARTLAGQVFGWRAFVSPVAAQFSAAQLWNPTGSGKRFVIKSLINSGSVATVYTTDTVLSATPAPGAVTNKFAGGGNSVAQAWSLNTGAAYPGTTKQLEALPLNVQTIQPEPIVIPPGFGLLIGNDSANTTLTIAVHFVEEDNV